MKIQLKSGLFEVLPFFLLSRILFFAILAITSSVSIERVPSREGVNFHLHLQEDFSKIKERVTKTLLSADSSWYLEISKYGYPEESSATASARHWVFFPAFPLIISSLAKITTSTLLPAIFINAVFFLVGLSVLSTYLSLSGFERGTRNFIIGCLCFHPYSYFFSTPHTEAGFFMLLVTSLFLASYRNSHLLLTGVLGFLLCYRPTGILIYPSLFLGAKNKRIFIVCSLFAVLGLSYYFYYLWQLTGSPFAWLVNQKVWGRGMGSYGLMGVLDEVRNIVLPWSFSFSHFLVTVLAICALSYFFFKKNFSFAFMILIPLLALLQTGTLLSVSRVMMPIFPVYIYLASVIKSEDARTMFLLSSAVVFGIMCLLYSLNVTIAMT